MKTVRFCINHSQRPARWRCYQCKSPLCKDCRRHLAKHYFCSFSCFIVFRFAGLKQQLKKRQNRILLGWNVVLTMMMIALLFLQVRQSSAIEPPLVSRAASLTVPSPPPARMLIDTLADGQPVKVLERARADYMLSVDVEPGWVVTVWQNQTAIFSTITGNQQRLEIPVALAFGKNDIRAGAWDQNQKLVFQDVREISYHNPYLETLRRPLLRGKRSLPFLALTFDGGANAGAADSILSILRRNNLQTTLFITGQFVERFPGIVRQMVADGHEVGNHTYSHPHLTTFEQNQQHQTLPEITRAALHRQLHQTDSLFYQLSGKHMAPLWRAPYGEYNQQILDWAAQAGYRHIGWTPGLDTFDWVSDTASAIFRTPAEILSHILGRERRQGNLNGSIILMHLGNRRLQQPVYGILDSLITAFREKNYQWVTVSKMLRP